VILNGPRQAARPDLGRDRRKLRLENWGQGGLPNLPNIAKRNAKPRAQLWAQSWKEARKMSLKSAGVLVWALALAGGRGRSAPALRRRPSASRSPVRPRRGMEAGPPIVLVHGAFGDAVGWQRVIPILQRDGYQVTPPSKTRWKSLAGDVATTRRVVEAQRGPVVLVGHSYGGGVINRRRCRQPQRQGACLHCGGSHPWPAKPLNAFRRGVNSGRYLRGAQEQTRPAS